WLTLRGSYIREFQTLNATFNNFNPSATSSNLNDVLDSMRLYASIAMGADNRVVLTGQYFRTSGTADGNLYGFDVNGAALTPNSDGWNAEIAYIPFGAGKAPGWPWFNARIGLQYTYYNRFNGTTVGAQTNNTLFLHAWMAM
ncbi:MAG: cytochrome C, partial [Xanthobacteraceae bacterium]